LFFFWGTIWNDTRTLTFYIFKKRQFLVFNKTFVFQDRLWKSLALVNKPLGKIPNLSMRAMVNCLWSWNDAERPLCQSCKHGDMFSPWLFQQRAEKNICLREFWVWIKAKDPEKTW
jgi:hypothetical protein